jgi:hypothetical protein
VPDSLAESLHDEHPFEAAQWRSVYTSVKPPATPQRPMAEDLRSLSYTQVLFDLWNRGVIGGGGASTAVDVAQLTRILREGRHPANEGDLRFVLSYAAPDAARTRASLPVVAAEDAAALGVAAGTSYDELVVAYLRDDIPHAIRAGHPILAEDAARGIGLVAARTSAALDSWVVRVHEIIGGFSINEELAVVLSSKMLQGFLDVVPAPSWYEPPVLHYLLLHATSAAPAASIRVALPQLIAYYQQVADAAGLHDWVARGALPPLGITHGGVEFLAVYAHLCVLARAAAPHVDDDGIVKIQRGLLALLGPSPLAETDYRQLPAIGSESLAADKIEGVKSIAARIDQFSRDSWTKLLSDPEPTQLALRGHALVQLGAPGILSDPEYRYYVGWLDLERLEAALKLEGSLRDDWNVMRFRFTRDAVAAAIASKRRSDEIPDEYEARVSSRIEELVRASHRYLTSDAVGAYVREVYDLAPGEIEWPFQTELDTLAVLDGVCQRIYPAVADSRPLELGALPPSTAAGAIRANLLAQRTARDLFVTFAALDEGQYETLITHLTGDGAKVLFEALGFFEEWTALLVATVRLVRAAGKLDRAGATLTGMWLANGGWLPELVAGLTDKDIAALKPYKAVFGAVGVLASAVQVWGDLAGIGAALRTGSVPDGLRQFANLAKHLASAGGDLVGIGEVFARALVPTWETAGFKLWSARLGILDNALGVLLYGHVMLTAARDGDPIATLLSGTATAGSLVATLAYVVAWAPKSVLSLFALEAGAAEVAAAIATASAVAGVASLIVAMGAFGYAYWDHYKHDYVERALDHLEEIGVIVRTVRIVSRQPVPGDVRFIPLALLDRRDPIRGWEGSGAPPPEPSGLGHIDGYTDKRVAMVELDTPAAWGDVGDWRYLAPVSGTYMFGGDNTAQYDIVLDDGTTFTAYWVATVELIALPPVPVHMPAAGSGVPEGDPTEWLAVEDGERVNCGDVLLRNQGNVVRARIPGTVWLTHHSGKPAPGIIALEIER